MIVDTPSMIKPENEMTGDSPEDAALLRGHMHEAKQFLKSQRWCRNIRSAWFGGGIGGIVLIAAFHIEPTSDDVDDWVWIICGDLPPAYIRADILRTPAKAFEGYIREMRRWVTAVTSGHPVKDLIPVNAQPTMKNADLLRRRLDFLEQRILPRLM
jgi:hypothetical protein